MSFTGLLTDTLDIDALAAGAQDGRGNEDGAYTEETAAVPCRFWQTKGDEDRDQRWADIVTFEAIVPAATTVTTEHRVRHDGRPYEVLAVDSVHGRAATHHLHLILGFTG